VVLWPGRDVMRSRFRFVWLFPLLLLLGCGGTMSSTSGNPPLNPGTWVSMSEATSCEVLVPANCSGLYGFTISNSGAFTAGPSPTGQKVVGDITASEMATLSSAANSYTTSVTGIGPCQINPAPTGASDVITMTATGANINVYLAGTTGDTVNFICVSADAGATSALVSAFQALRLKYYPNPFPS